jgi:hypothetical protein
LTEPWRTSPAAKVWKVDPRTDEAKRISLPHRPAGWPPPTTLSR